MEKRRKDEAKLRVGVYKYTRRVFDNDKRQFSPSSGSSKRIISMMLL